MSDSEEEMDGLDDDTTIVPPVTPNTFGRGLIKRLGIAKTAEAAGSSINNKGIETFSSRKTKCALPFV